MILSKCLHVLQTLPRYRSTAHDPPSPGSSRAGLAKHHCVKSTRQAALSQLDCCGSHVTTSHVIMTRSRPPSLDANRSSY
jgi:hypothetical protein